MRRSKTLLHFIAAILLGWGGAAGAPVGTTITPNGFGTSVTAANGTYNITGGTVPTGSTRLLQSFSNFNLGTGDTADFDVASNITNILARVTGGASTIDGTITATLPGGGLSSASLYFLNPAGVLFTSNAQVKLGGAFVVSTADNIQFASGTPFWGDINHPSDDGGITSAAVSAFGFISGTPQPITLAGAQLINLKGADLIGGDITFEQDAATARPALLRVVAPGKLTLFSAAGTGTVAFTATNPGAGYSTASTGLGNITIQNRAVVSSGGNGGGGVVIRGGRIVVDDSNVAASNINQSTASAGGTISVQADSLTVQNGGLIKTDSYYKGNAGSVTITANTLTVDGTNNGGTTTAAGSTEIASTADYQNGTFTGTHGTGGAVSVNVVGQLTLENGGDIAAGTVSSGNSGNVTVSAGTLTLDGVGSAISANADSINGNPGSAGSISVTTTSGALTLTHGAQIESTAAATGSGHTAANITVAAAALTVDGTASLPGSTGIYLESTGQAAAPGTLHLTVTGATSLLGGGEIESRNEVAGNAGSLTLTTPSLTLTGSSSIATETTGSGNAGALTVNVANALSVANGAEIITSTAGAGANGALTVTAGSATIDGASFQYGTTGIISESISPANTAANGALSVHVTNGLGVNDGGEIASATLTSGNGGATAVQAGSATINGATVAVATLQNGVFATPDSNLYEPITFDGSLNTSASSLLFGPIYDIPTPMGDQVGDNLFLSFDLFDLSHGDAAVFTGTGVQDIIARITGGASSVDGTIASTISGANLFLIDSSGLAFGPHAGVSSTGSFVATTADAVKFSDGIFHAQTGEDAGFSSMPVDAISFASATPAPISFTNSQMAMQAGAGFSAIGGDVTLNGATLLAPGGEMALFSAAGAGDVPFSIAAPWAGFASATTSAFGKLTLENESTVAIDGSGGGSLGLRGGAVLIDNSQISSANFGNGTGGDLTIDAGTLTLQNSTSAVGATNDANSAEIGASTSSTYGDAGSITLNVDGALTVLDGASISSITTGTGNSGDVDVNAGSVSLDGSYFVADQEIIRRSQIESITSSFLAAAPLSNSQKYGASGSVTVTATGGVSVSDGAQISANTDDNGDAGTMSVTAGAIDVDGVANNNPTDLPNNVVFASTIGSNTFSSGNAGPLTLQAGTINLMDGGVVNSSSAGAGAVGAVSITANELTISGEQVQLAPPGSTNIINYGSAVNSTTSSTGVAGAITLNIADTLTLSDGGRITTSAGGTKDAGIATVNVGTLNIDGEYLNPAIKPDRSGIYSSAQHSNGGTVIVNATGSVNLTNDGVISASSNTGNAGNISITAAKLALDTSAQIETTAKLDGGNVTVDVGNLVYLHNSQITTQAGRNGGNITIDPQMVVLSDGLLDASAGETGGRISITADNFLSSDMVMTATGGVANGAIDIASPDLDLSGSLAPLASALVSNKSLLRASCARSINHEFSSFILVGRGGTESAPEELQSDFGFGDSLQ